MGLKDFILCRMFNRKSSDPALTSKDAKAASVVLGVESPKPIDENVKPAGIQEMRPGENQIDTLLQTTKTPSQSHVPFNPFGVHEIQVEHLHRDPPEPPQHKVVARPVDAMSVGVPLFANVEYITRHGLPVDRDDVKRIAIPVVPIQKHEDENYDDTTSNRYSGSDTTEVKSRFSGTNRAEYIVEKMDAFTGSQLTNGGGGGQPSLVVYAHDPS